MGEPAAHLKAAAKSGLSETGPFDPPLRRRVGVGQRLRARRLGPVVRAPDLRKAMKACCSSSKPPTFEGGWPCGSRAAPEIINFTPPSRRCLAQGKPAVEADVLHAR